MMPSVFPPETSVSTDFTDAEAWSFKLDSHLGPIQKPAEKYAGLPSVRVSDEQVHSFLTVDRILMSDIFTFLVGPEETSMKIHLRAVRK